MEINRNKVLETYDERSKLNTVNSVLGGNSDPVSIHSDIYLDYFTKRFLLKSLKLKRNDVVLDFGCGVGRLSTIVARKAKLVNCVDISEPLIKMAQKNHHDNINYKCIKGISDIPLLNYNKIFTVGVLYHLNDSELLETLKFFNNALCEDGNIVLIEHFSKTTNVLGDIGKQRTKKDWSHAFVQSGLEIISTYPIIRIPSYGLHIWKKSPPSKIVLSVLKFVEKLTMHYKEDNVTYFYQVVVLGKSKEVVKNIKKLK